MPRAHFNRCNHIEANSWSIRNNWVPSDLGTQLLAWYKADDLDATLNDNDAVTTWADKCAVGPYDLGTGGLNKPVFKTSIVGPAGSEHDVVRFVTNDSMVCTTVPSTAQPYTFVLVGATSTANDVFMGGGVALSVPQIYSNAGGKYAISAPTALASTVDDGATFKMIQAEFNGNYSRIWINNALVGSGAAGAQAFEDIYVGQNQAGTFLTAGDIAEILIIDHLLTPRNKDLLWRYLKALYVLTGAP